MRLKTLVGIFLALLASSLAGVHTLLAMQVSGDYFPSPVGVGGQLTCTFTLYNDQGATASGAFTNPIPPSTIFVSAAATNGAFVISNNVFSYVPAPIDPGQQVVFSMVLTPVSAQLITNLATWGDSTGDVVYSGWVIPVSPAVAGPKMNVGRVDHRSTRLANGSVLITGGLDMGGLYEVTTSTAEVYDPTANEFRLVGDMSVPRRIHTATLLTNGMVLVAGGYRDGSEIAITNVDLFDPNNNVFIPTASLSVPRATHSATLLPNGDVILAGGAGISTLIERFHFANGLGTISKAGDLQIPRSGHVATLLPSGEILFAGGTDASNPFAERFNPETGISEVVASSGHAEPAVAVARETVLLHGWTIQPSFAAEMYDIESNSFAVPVAAPTPAAGENYLTLDTGVVLITAGYFSYAATIFDPRAGTFTASYPLAGTRSNHSAVQLADGRVLLTGGYDFVGAMSSDSRSTEIYAIRVDQDQDGMDDAWELANGFDPTRREDAIEDADGDGFTNLQEYLAGTDPHDPHSYLHIEGAQQITNSLHIRFASVLGKYYNVERAGDLVSGNWVSVARNIAGTGSTIDISDPLLPGSTNQLYRVLVVP
jgi:hypothetical protein